MCARSLRGVTVARKISKASFVMRALRKASYRWGPINEAGRLATSRRGYRHCAICGEEWHYKQTQKDHIIPVVPVTGFDSWDGVINRMFVDSPDQIQILCKADHQLKSGLEAADRAKYRTRSKLKRRTK
jgi:hypothetical protein